MKFDKIYHGKNGQPFNKQGLVVTNILLPMLGYLP
jgi:hypothetical protein